MVCLGFIALMAGCKPGVPEDVIQPDKMENILYDYFMSREMASNSSADGNSSFRRTMYFHTVLKKHGVSEAEFDSSLVYYYGHCEDFTKIYNRVGERMENYAKSIGVNTNGMGGDMTVYSASGDTANIWRGQTALMLLPSAPYNRFDFELPIDTTYHRGDSFMLTFFVNYLYQQGTKDAVAYMDVKYDNDSIASYSTSINISGQSQLRIGSNRGHDIKSIRGFILLNRGRDRSSTLKLMFIDNIQFVRFHAKESLNNNEPSIINESVNTQNSSSSLGAPRRDMPRPGGGGARPPVGRGDSLVPPSSGRAIRRVGGGDVPIKINRHDENKSSKVKITQR